MLIPFLNSELEADVRTRAGCLVIWRLFTMAYTSRSRYFRVGGTLKQLQCRMGYHKEALTGLRRAFVSKALRDNKEDGIARRFPS